jgi:hypothetical protein
MQTTLEYEMARAGNADRWVPACGGSEQPFTARSGKRMLYCWNPALNRHAYLDLGTDMIMTDEEARANLML